MKPGTLTTTFGNPMADNQTPLTAGAPGSVLARFLQQFDPGQGDYTAERSRILGNPSVDAVAYEIERRRTGPLPK